MDAVTKFNASCVIILGLLNLGAGVYLVVPCVGQIGFFSYSKIVVAEY